MSHAAVASLYTTSVLRASRVSNERKCKFVSNCMLEEELDHVLSEHSYDNLGNVHEALGNIDIGYSKSISTTNTPKQVRNHVMSSDGFIKPVQTWSRTQKK